MFNEFNKLYGIKAGTSFKFVELWKAILDNFGSIGFNYWKPVKLEDQKVVGGYTCGFQFEWETYVYDTQEPEPTCYEALCKLLIKLHEDYYTDEIEDLFPKLEGVIQKVYKEELNGIN